MNEEKSLDEVVGQDAAIAAMRTFADDIDRGAERRPLMLSGPAGTGKSLSARLLAKEHGWHMVELNASDYRDTETIDRTLLSASRSRSIFGSRNLILLDEIDELVPRFDNGAASAIMHILHPNREEVKNKIRGRNPVMFIANDRWHRNIAFLRAEVDSIEFRKLQPYSILQVITRYAKAEGLHVDRGVLTRISNTSKGDARSAINDAITMDNAPPDVFDEVIGVKNRNLQIFEILDRVFTATTVAAPRHAIESAGSEMEPDMMIKWIDENIPKRYSDPEDMSRAYAMLSCATVFASRASRSQYYAYWRYMSTAMSSGVALSREGGSHRSGQYTFPRVINALSSTKQKRRTELEIAETLGKKIHVGTRRIRNTEMKVLGEMIRMSAGRGKASGGGTGGKSAADSTYDFFMSKFGLDEDEVDWLADPDWKRKEAGKHDGKVALG